MALLSKAHTYGSPSFLAWPAALVGLQLMAFWRAWTWYVNRVWGSSEGILGLVILLTTLALLFKRPRATAAAGEIPLMPLILLLGFYTMLYGFVPPIVRAAIAVTSVGTTLHLIYFRRLPEVHTWGLLMLALPVVPSLQFYLGYPARVAAASLAVPMLQMTGLSVGREGAYLVWNEEMVLFDAPCSGVKMLWAGVFVTFALSNYYRLGPIKLLFASIACVLAILFGNALRATSLFYMESGILKVPHWCHNLVGLISYALVVVTIAYSVRRIKKW